MGRARRRSRPMECLPDDTGPFPRRSPSPMTTGSASSICSGSGRGSNRDLKARIDAVLAHGQFILGPEVETSGEAPRRLHRRGACHGGVERARRADDRPDGDGREARRRGLRPGLHLRRDRGGGGLDRGEPGLRRRRSGDLQHGPRRPRTGDRRGRGRGPAQADRGDAGRPLRPSRRLRRDRQDRGEARHDGARRRGAEHRRRLGQCPGRGAGADLGDELLPDQAARLLRRRRGDPYRSGRTLPSACG